MKILNPKIRVGEPFFSKESPCGIAARALFGGIYYDQ